MDENTQPELTDEYVAKALAALEPLDPILQHFQFDHLQQEDTRKASKHCAALALVASLNLPRCAERTAGLRKLLEAKDCFVRAAREGVRIAQAKQASDEAASK